MSQNEPKQEVEVPPDPILTRSLSVPIAIASLLCLAAVVLAIYDEAWTRRPYKAYQVEFYKKYADYLTRLGDEQKGFEEAIEKLARHEELRKAVEVVQAATESDRKRLQNQVLNLSNRITAFNAALRSPNSELSAAKYDVEHAADGEHKAIADSADAREYLAEIEEIKARQIEFSWEQFSLSGDAKTVEEAGTVADLRQVALDLQAEKGATQTELGKVSKPVSAASAALNAYSKSSLASVGYFLQNCKNGEHSKKVSARVREVGAAQYLDRYRTGLSSSAVSSLRQEAEDSMPIVPVLGGDVIEIHIRDANGWVDRCETCHLGIQSPVPITAEDVPGSEGYERLFVSHPRPELLAVHDPERFGCSTCHGGNGVAITNTVEAHGLNKHWLQKMHLPEHSEAGCVQCHENDHQLAMGERITNGRKVFLRYGCWGCHKREGYDAEEGLLSDVAKDVQQLENTIAAKQMRIVDLNEALQVCFDDDEDRFEELEPENKRRRNALAREIGGHRTELIGLLSQQEQFGSQRKRVGPDLAGVKSKLRPEWITQWIRDPKGWRHETKMPNYRWDETFDGSEMDADDAVKDIAAFLWQSASDLRLPSRRQGDVARGRELFESVGCLGCHGMGEGEDRIGSWFAANLSNLGEKANYDYMVAWIKDPKSLNPGTVMPNLRLDDDDAQDIATYLLSNKRDGEVREPAPWLTETDRFDRGRRYVQHFGCAGCHDIPGMEAEARIGVELTKHGSRPKERLDFGHYTVAALRGTEEPLLDYEAPLDGGKAFEGWEGRKWHTHIGFFMHKVADPGLYDHGRHLPNWFERSRMPRFNVSAQDLKDVATFLVGSVDTDLVPDAFKYDPDERARAVRDGWPVVQRYNCQGCHQVEADDVPTLWSAPGFQVGGEHEKDRPPSLVGTGFRTQPAWLAHFLHDPALGGGVKNPKSARPYLSARMPTFDFTEEEVGKIVRFFDARAVQPIVYQMPVLEPLTAAEMRMARGMFQEANCAKCHVVEGLPFTTETKAPNLSLAPTRLRPEWIRRWIMEPQLMEPTTAMPALFNDDDGDGRWTFGGAAKVPGLNDYAGDHIDLMVRYLNDPDFEK